MVYFLGILLFSAWMAYSAPNQIVNSSFTSFDLSTGQPEGWQNTPALTGLRIRHPDRPGHFVLQLSAEKDGKTAFWIGTLKSIEPMRQYRLTAIIKIPQGFHFRVYVERSKPEFRAFNGNVWIRGTGEWQQVELQFCYETPGSQPYFVFCVNQPVNALLADCQVIPITEDRSI